MVADLPSLAESLLQSPLGGAIDPIPVTVGLVLLVLATVSALSSAALLVYSPTRLQKLLGPTRGPAVAARLSTRELEFRILARLVMVASATGCLILTGTGVDGVLGNTLFAGVCLLMVFLVVVLPAVAVRRGAARVLTLTLPVLHPLGLLLFPLIRVLVWACRPLLRALKIPEQTTIEPEQVVDEILAAVDDSAVRGHLEEEVRAWIGNIVELKELHTSEVMTPRTDIHAMEANTPLFEAIKQAVEEGHSRFPVYKESIDNVVGVFYVKDVLSRLAKEQDTSNITVGEVAREPMFAPESMRVSDLLADFRRTKVQMAIVLDEYGGTAGLITIEDVLEEIVGEITDEFDPDEEDPIKTIEGHKIIEVAGRARVEEVNSALCGELVPTGEDYDTIAGFVFAHLGQIPQSGETFQAGDVEYRILSVSNRRIARVRLTVLAPQPTDG